MFPAGLWVGLDEWTDRQMNSHPLQWQGATEQNAVLISIILVTFTPLLLRCDSAFGTDKRPGFLRQARSLPPKTIARGVPPSIHPSPGFLGRAQQSRDGLIESCTCHRSRPPLPPPTPQADPLGQTLHCHVMASCDHVMDGSGRSAFTLRKHTCCTPQPPGSQLYCTVIQAQFGSLHTVNHLNFELTK